MLRRDFLSRATVAPLLSAGWRTAPPKAFLDDLRFLMRAASVPGLVIGAVREGRTAWITPMGERAKGGRAMDAGTLFQAASLTKQVIAHAAFELRAKGQLDFERTLVSYVDDLPNEKARTVRVRHVLSHSSGFPNWRFVDRGKPEPPLEPGFEPGTRFQYSGEGYFYLQRVMEQVTGKGIGAVVKELVFAPLGMNDSTLVWDPATLERTAVPHSRRGEARQNWGRQANAVRELAAKLAKPVDGLRYEDYSKVPADAGDPVLPNWMAPNGAASMVTTARDYARFVDAASKRPELLAQQVEINEFLGWGLGWAIERVGGRTFLWQWGDNGGFKNFVLAEPAAESAMFVFTNGDNGARVYERILTRATGMEHPALLWV